MTPPLSYDLLFCSLGDGDNGDNDEDDDKEKVAEINWGSDVDQRQKSDRQ